MEAHGTTFVSITQSFSATTSMGGCPAWSEICGPAGGRLVVETVTVRVPPSIRTRGGRNVVLSPDGSVMPDAPRQVKTVAEPTLLKALGRAFRWQKLLDAGTYASISDIARAEKLDRTYVGDVLRLTLLPPWLVEAIMEGRQGEAVTLPVLMKPFEVEWVGQHIKGQPNGISGC